MIIFIFATDNSSFISFGAGNYYSLFEGQLIFMINNRDQSSFDLTVYSSVPISQIVLSSSDIVNHETGDKIVSDNIKFDSHTVLPINNLARNSPQSIPVVIDGQYPGLFSGIFYVDGSSSTSIPISLDVRSNSLQSLIWVINGIAVSMGLWKLIKYLNERIIIEREFRYQNVNTRGKLFVTKKKNPKEIDTFTTYLTRKEITNSKVLVDAILNGFSIFFGIFLGLITLANEEFFATMRNIGQVEIFILLAVGLGIGSLKEYVYAK